MNLEYIRNFIQLSQYRSFSQLANNLSISQSTLSHRISQLEEELGKITLINRTTKSFELTQQGEEFLKYAKKIIDLYDESREKLLNYGDYKAETIVITTSKLPGSHILPKYLAKFKNENSFIQFKTLINNSQKSIDFLRKNMADFAGVGSFMDSNKGEFDYIKIGDDSMYFICSVNHELIRNGNNPVNFDDLKKYPFISREVGSGTRNIFEKEFPRHNELNITLEINDNDSIISAVSDSNYISVLSEEIAKKAEDAGLITILELKSSPKIAKREIYFLKLKSKEISNTKTKFWNYLKKNSEKQ
ncbi:MAG: LysR family transcriptional regulator [Candidatus Lokiarchaeota archaeon]|nr:LysR family transcriptional regulator [Candidatus Lokiarchaeota archaeon]MBD3198747.1 LysR family transcriptional regulator [Candidatus Lokiarchaeota archaeon]